MQPLKADQRFLRETGQSRVELLALLNLRPQRGLDKAGQTFSVTQEFFCSLTQSQLNAQRGDGTTTRAGSDYPLATGDPPLAER